MAWTHQHETPGLLATPISEIPFTQGSGYDPCAVCSRTVPVSDDSIVCRNQCGRKFHNECVEDDSKSSVLCQECASLPLLKTAQVEEYRNLVRHILHDEVEEYRVKFQLNELWPSEDSIADVLAGYETLSDDEDLASDLKRPRSEFPDIFHIEDQVHSSICEAKTSKLFFQGCRV